jgi:branched-chain amino acid aminotransferase
MTYNIKKNPTTNSKLASIDFDNIPFGRVFSDHIFIADYADGEWQNMRIEPFDKMTISPANMTLHYGQSIFEGLKVTSDSDNNPLFLRLDKHANRLNRSAYRMAIPEIPTDLFKQAIMELVELDKNWIPKGEDTALYVRPFVFAADEFLGVKPSDKYKFMIFTCPVGAYYAAPVSITTMPNYVRAFPGGTGFAKAAGNYAGSLRPTVDAHEKGYDQVMWLDGVEKNYIHECGTMNLMFVIDDVIVTPPTNTGEILEGITRDSIITIFKAAGFKVEERPITIDELIEAHKAGRLQEAFGTGTAAVVSQIVKIAHGDVVMELPPVENRKYSHYAKAEIVAIRKGEKDPFNWIERGLHPVNA